MSIRDKMNATPTQGQENRLDRFGITSNPFPTSSQTTSNPHYPIPEDDDAEQRILTFFRDGRSQVLVVLGTQGVGKTNFMNYIESQILDAKPLFEGHYIVRYMADPEPSFDSTIRTILQELGKAHLKEVAKKLVSKQEVLNGIRSFDLRQALLSLMKEPDDDDLIQLAFEWLLGFRLLNAHRHRLGVSFRLDTVESRTAALRDFIFASTEMGLLKGIFLLLDELEKQAGVLGATAVVRYLSAMRAIIDALPEHLFMVIAITPDAMRRYSSALPAFRSRLENQILLSPLASLEEAKKLAEFYIKEARTAAQRSGKQNLGSDQLITDEEVLATFSVASKASERRGDEGVRQREFLNTLHDIAEKKIRSF